MVIYLPKITAENFGVFRKLLKDDVGATFDEWLQRRWNRITEYSNGNTVIEINVNPDGFTRFCDEKSLPYDGNSLLAFAEMIGKSNA
jgi:hypothetical protein